MQTKKTLFLSRIALVWLSFVALARDPAPIYPDNYKVIIENDRVRVAFSTTSSFTPEQQPRSACIVRAC